MRQLTNGGESCLPMANDGYGNRPPKLRARIGIDSGAVVVGTGAGREID
jgi:class 3 adenylate cyclase